MGGSRRYVASPGKRRSSCLRGNYSICGSYGSGPAAKRPLRTIKRGRRVTATAPPREFLFVIGIHTAGPAQGVRKAGIDEIDGYFRPLVNLGNIDRDGGNIEGPVLRGELDCIITSDVGAGDDLSANPKRGIGEAVLVGGGGENRAVYGIETVFLDEGLLLYARRGILRASSDCSISAPLSLKAAIVSAS